MTIPAKAPLDPAASLGTPPDPPRVQYAPPADAAPFERVPTAKLVSEAGQFEHLVLELEAERADITKGVELIEAKNTPAETKAKAVQAWRERTEPALLKQAAALAARFDHVLANLDHVETNPEAVKGFAALSLDRAPTQHVEAAKFLSPTALRPILGDLVARGQWGVIGLMEGAIRQRTDISPAGVKALLAVTDVEPATVAHARELRKKLGGLRARLEIARLTNPAAETRLGMLYRYGG